MNSPPAPAPAVSVPIRPAVVRPAPRAAFAGLALIVLLSTLNTSIVNVALPALVVRFGGSSQAVQWTVLSFVLAITTLSVSAGRLADLVGRRRLLLAGVVLFTVAAAACAAAPGLGWLIAARFFQGMGAAVMLAISVALIGDLTAAEQAGRAMGLLGSMSALGTALGPALGGWLIAAWEWPAIFLLSVPLGGVAFGLLWCGLPTDGAAVRARPSDFDALGTVLLGASLAAGAIGLTRGRDGLGEVNAVWFALAIGGMSWFVRVQRRSASPLLRLEMLNEPALRSNLAMSGLVAGVMMSTLVVGPFYLTQALHVDAGTLGLVLSVGPIAAASVATPAGRLVDRVGASLTTVVGLIAATAGCLALGRVSPRLGLTGFVVPVAVLTSGYALFQTANNTAVMQRAAASHRGVISGMLNLSRNLGLLAGTSLLGAVFAFAVGPAGPADAVAVAFATRVTFVTATLLLVAALGLALRALTRGAAAGGGEKTTTSSFSRIA